jgi:hypothetical protein
MGLSFTALFECEFCGEPLTSADEDCPLCSDRENQDILFRNIFTDETRSVEVAIAASPCFMWEKFARSLDGEDPIPYAIIGSKSTVDLMLQHSSVGDVSQIKPRQMSKDYYGEEDLRELASF